MSVELRIKKNWAGFFVIQPFSVITNMGLYAVHVLARGENTGLSKLESRELTQEGVNHAWDEIAEVINFLETEQFMLDRGFSLQSFAPVERQCSEEAHGEGKVLAQLLPGGCG